MRSGLLRRQWHLFEFEDLDWFPQTFRRYITDLLRYQLVRFRVYDVVSPMLSDLLRSTKSSEIVDLCSGSAGAAMRIAELVQQDVGMPIKLTLTDKFPNREVKQALEATVDSRVQYLGHSVDATNVPADLKGVRTLFTSFHHFPPDLALKMLEDAALKRAPIAIFEFTERTPANLLKALFLSPLLVWLTTPLVRPFSIGRLFWTYVIPVITIAYTWDAFASHVRTYSTRDLEHLVDKLDAPGYSWTTGKVPVKGLGFNVTYLTGTPA